MVDNLEALSGLIKKQLENYTEEIQKEIDEYFFSILI